MWNQTMNFTKTIDVLLVLEVFDEELIKDDVIGMTTVALRKYLNSPGTTHNGSSTSLCRNRTHLLEGASGWHSQVDY